MSSHIPKNQVFRGHIPELDGLRAAGTAMVLLNHLWPKSLSVFVWDLGRLAWIAMDSFFVLSGFLIAGILLDARRKPDYYRSYYTRRSLRIFPLYYCVLTYLICASLLWRGGAYYRQLVTDWGSPAWFFVYLGNFTVAIAGSWPMIAPGLTPLWSLQVEEQFYLLIPLAIRRLRLATLSRILWVMVFLSPAIRVALFSWNPHNPYLQYVLLPCRMEGLALGALVAIRFRTRRWEVTTSRKARLTTLTLLLLAATCVGSVWSNPSRLDEEAASPFNRTVGYFLSSTACCCLLVWLIHFRGSRFTRWLRLRPVQYVGKISYGIYLLHMPVRTVVEFVWHALGWNLPSDALLKFGAVFVLSIASASVSWYFLERPLLRLKDRWAPVVSPARKPPDFTPTTLQRV
jgi:peptidoglycan/LPS O-acetylase OafA/YrhL